MAKKPEKQLSPERKELISKLIDEFDIKSAKDIENMFSPMLQEMLEGELDDHLATGNTSIAEKADSTAAMATAARQLRPHSETWISTFPATATAHSSRRW